MIVPLRSKWPGHDGEKVLLVKRRNTAEEFALFYRHHNGESNLAICIQYIVDRFGFGIEAVPDKWKTM